MKWLPYQRLTLYTRLSPREALDRIREEVEPYEILRRSMTTLPYRGTIAHYDFKYRGHPNFEISQNYGIFNRPSIGSIPLTITGRIQTDADYTRIDLTLRLQAAWMLFWSIILAILAVMYIALNVRIVEGSLLMGDKATLQDGTALFLYLAFFEYMITLGYNTEAKRVLGHFEELLEAAG